MEKAAKTFELKRENSGLAYLQAPLFLEAGWIDHAFSTRRGGQSTGTFTGLNTGFHVGDRWERVLENRRLFFDCFNYDYRDIVSATQVHGVAVRLFDKSNRGEGAFPNTTRSRCDALVTREEGLPLAAYSADCQLIYFACPGEKPVVALAHAGWKGTLGGIGGRVIRFMEDNFFVKPERIMVALGPAVCRRCYLVSRDLADRFREAGWDDENYLEPNEKGDFHLDLNAINTEKLLLAGIRKTNLSLNEWCTSCNPGLFYSYRRDRGITGRMLGFIAINNSVSRM